MSKTDNKIKSLARIIGPTLGLFIGIVAVGQGLDIIAGITLWITIWTTTWWVFEAVPIPVASLVPISMLPLLGVLDSKQVAQAYGHKLVLLLLGGFLLSRAMEKSGAHRRLALQMVSLCGGGGKSLILGFMVASAGLSMWISNTATTLMMLPLVIAVLEGAEDQKIRIPLLLGVAFAANVGGIGTPIGTPPNMVMIGYYETIKGVEISFLEWMKVGVPVSIIMVVVIWLWLSRNIKNRSVIPLPSPGRWRKEEKRTLAIFFFTALAWMTRSSPFGGWKNFFGAVSENDMGLYNILSNANDASVAFIAVIILFCTPSGNKKNEKLLDWETANQIPWGLIILVGSGICLGSAISESGLSEYAAKLLSGIENFKTIFVILCIALLVTFLTEITSNTATTVILMPILGAVSIASGIDAVLFLIPAALSASCAFMLPVATMPNAVVYGAGEFSIKIMVKEGFVLNLVGALVVTGVCYFILF
ncbi:MAG: sodium:dicarboxylate symporter [Candidatus Marinimicrobia bacterium]|nr:sodium:dicarboxylate symporter [Candidatus Neomarinimicrobiota bacterium]